MLEGEVATPPEIESVAQKVLGIERATFRRAWGVRYAVAAVLVFVEGIMPVVIFELGLSAWYTISIGFVLSIAVSLLALMTAVRIVRRVYALRFVRKAITGSLWVRAIRPLPALIIFVLAYSALIATAEFFPGDFYTILYGAEVAGLPWAYFFLKVTFPEGLPRARMCENAFSNYF
jgi:hypothetical protein